jgi:hypothetical protein
MEITRFYRPGFGTCIERSGCNGMVKRNVSIIRVLIKMGVTDTIGNYRQGEGCNNGSHYGHRGDFHRSRIGF